MERVVRIDEIARGEDLARCRELFREYASSLDVSLDFQGFEEELAGLPGDYVGPRGALLLARVDGRPAACAALRAWGTDECELKRLYVRPASRGGGLGRSILDAAIGRARATGARALRLDTLPSMHAAMALYRSVGFEETAAYHDATVPGMRFFRLVLRP
jgi:putative acetyltransferase